MRLLQGFFLWLALNGTAGAQTYQEWLAAAPNSPTSAVRVEFEAASHVPVATQMAVEDKLPARPRGGEIGQLHIQVEARNAPRLPLKLEVLVSPLAPDDLRPLPVNVVFAWGKPLGQLRPDAPLRPERYRLERELAGTDPAAGFTVPVLIPSLSNDYRTHATLRDMFSLRYLLIDANGRALARGLLAEAYHNDGIGRGARYAWVIGGDTEADRVLRENLDVSNLQTLKSWPKTDQGLLDIDALWLSSSVWAEQPYAPSVWQRAVLSGLWVVGKPETVASLKKALGAPQSPRVLLGGIETPDPKLQDPQWQTRNAGLQSSWSHETVSAQRLFEPYLGGYSGWTLAILGVFAGFTLLILPILFFRLHGARRLALWWIVPATSLAIAVVGYAGAKRSLPAAPLAHFVEYRFAYAPWREVYHHAYLRLLATRGEALNVSGPSEFAAPVAARDVNLRLEAVTDVGGQARYALQGARPGSIINKEFTYFGSAEPPVARAEPPAYLVVRRPLKELHVWEDGQWRSFGPVAAGTRLSRDDGQEGGPPSAVLPEALRNACETENTGLKRGRDPRLDFAGQAIVVARGEDRPVLRIDAPEARVSQAVIWVLQIPIAADRPTAPEAQP